MNLTLPYILTFFLASLRLGALLMMIPAMGGNFVPMQIRIALVFAITVLMIPAIEVVGLQNNINIWELSFWAVGELLLGFFMGICVRALFAIMEVAGHLISQEIGLMMAEQFDPASGANSNLIGVLLFYFTTILFFIIGGHLQVIQSLATSFQIVPIIKNDWEVSNFQTVASVLGQVFSLAVSIAAPFIAVNFIITLGFGVLGKVAPKINVMLLSFSFRIVGGMLIFFITANLIFNFLLHYSEEVPASMLEFLQR